MANSKIAGNGANSGVRQATAFYNRIGGRTFFQMRAPAAAQGTQGLEMVMETTPTLTSTLSRGDDEGLGGRIDEKQLDELAGK